MAKPDVSKEVLSLLQEGNKPYSVNEVFEKCGKEYGKAAVQKALDSLLFREKIVEKAFGKQKIYFIRQSSYDPKEVKSELQMLTQKKALSDSSLKTKQDKIRELETKLKSFSAIPSLDALEAEKKNLQESVDELTVKLDNIRAKQGVKISSEDIKKVEKRHAKYLSVYRKRKRICTDMIDAILEGYPKSKKILIQDIGLETDEAAGFTPPK
ncbi:homologous-pairing protein 2 homolog [Episyrphus balteatus]|uniref:homologous-pairing protein 2 homolog n=1 Tax=Episyrphus balteatus TaxID=286459 RepID=UPI0024859F1B|nr:homologous-pairing protein 2 homolog [Episyrphus balteatus]